MFPNSLMSTGTRSGKGSVHDQVMTRIRSTLDAHRRTQDSIRTASTNGITH